MTHDYTLQTKILKPIDEVFSAVFKGETLTKYFCDEVSQDLDEGAEVTWVWTHHGQCPVNVKTVRENELIEIALDSQEWGKTKDYSYEILLRFAFESLTDGSTMLSISESGWQTDEDGLRGSHDNCGGWQHMALCLKAYLEYGIELRR